MFLDLAAGSFVIVTLFLRILICIATKKLFGQVKDKKIGNIVVTLNNAYMCKNIYTKAFCSNL